MLRKLSREFRRLLDQPRSVASLPGEGQIPAERDTGTAIRMLDALAAQDPDAVAILMALANLYRAQGNIEQAVRIRSSLVSRPEQDTGFSALAAFELAGDYLRAGVVDRALEQLDQAGKRGHDLLAVQADRARILAASGNYLGAAREYRAMGHALAEAHYLVKAAEDAGRDKDEDAAMRLVKKALAVYPSSLEALRVSLCMSAQAEEWGKLGEQLEKAAGLVDAQMVWLLLDALLDLVTQGGDRSLAPDLAKTVCAVVESQPPLLLNQYYCARLLMQAGQFATARAWLEKSLVVDPDFWPARVEMLSALERLDGMGREAAEQVDNLKKQTSSRARFACGVCGLRQAAVFFLCPRCASWYSITYRHRPQE